MAERAPLTDHSPGAVLSISTARLLRARRGRPTGSSPRRWTGRRRDYDRRTRRRPSNGNTWPGSANGSARPHDPRFDPAVTRRRPPSGAGARGADRVEPREVSSSSDWWTARSVNSERCCAPLPSIRRKGASAPNRARSGSVRDHRGGGVRQHDRARLGRRRRRGGGLGGGPRGARQRGAYAGASQATVFGECEEGQLVVSIRDDGVGFEPAALDASNGRFGISHSIVGRIEDLAARYGSTARPEGEPRSSSASRSPHRGGTT